MGLPPDIPRNILPRMVPRRHMPNGSGLRRRPRLTASGISPDIPTRRTCMPTINGLDTIPDAAMLTTTSIVPGRMDTLPVASAPVMFGI
jgi:hypothetical protein